ncbi:MAG: polysaccharide pyruvyl transferase family protein [Clostridia bacterium]|nr:polysaccharide pyruvyl transferase family protein [Clostridia bacterium]
MKCGIVTVYNSENCGSFLQAYALSRALENEGHEAVFVRQAFGDHSASRSNYFKQIVKTMLKGRLSAAKRLAKRRAVYKDACERHFNIVPQSEHLPAYILGSDVIWDVTVPFFKNHIPFFFGTQFRGARVISYAPAVGFAKEKDISACPEIQAALNSMHAVSVRDDISRELLGPLCEKKIEKVCDPTYLVNREVYDEIAAPCELDNFIFLYYYGNMTDSDREALLSLAKSEGLTIVTFGNFNPWCDMSLAYDPLLFLSLYKKAKYIVTNTFHGTVFATIYEKRFAIIKNEIPKVIDVLRLCALSDKMTSCADDISRILHSHFDYETTRGNISAERERSLDYLRGALLERGENEE